MKAKYSLIIRWSDEDECYIAWIPEFGTGVKTHGDSYEEAAKMGREVIEMMMDDLAGLESLPKPWIFDSEVNEDDEIGKSLFPDHPAYQPPKARELATPKRNRK